MNRESWIQVGPPLSALLGQRSCEAAFSDELANDNPELYTAFDESVKSEGISEELLTRLAPYAEGSLILVVTLNGHVTISKGIEDGSSRGGGASPSPGAAPRCATAAPPAGPEGAAPSSPRSPSQGRCSPCKATTLSPASTWSIRARAPMKRLASS